MTHWHVLGVGSIGGLFAHHLRHSAHVRSVSLLFRSQSSIDHFRATGGLTVESSDPRTLISKGEGIDYRLESMDKPAAPQNTAISNLLVTTKAHQVRSF
eukprot:7787912-Pyramimonas_sp.AAC.1